MILRLAAGSPRLVAASRTGPLLALAIGAGLGLGLKLPPGGVPQLWLLLPGAVAFLVGWSNAASP